MTESESYLLEYSDKARADLKKLDKEIARLMTRKLKRLTDNVHDLSHIALTGQWSGYYRMRARDYRAIYRINHEEQLVYVQRVGHRSSVYD